MARLELNPSGVIFNEELHEYWLDGKQLSGITDVLHRQLYPNEFDGIPVVRWSLLFSCARNKLYHQIGLLIIWEKGTCKIYTFLLLIC